MDEQNVGCSGSCGSCGGCGSASEEELPIMVLTNEEGEDVTFEKLDVVVLDDEREFLILAELKDDFEEEESIVILEIKEVDGEQVFDTLTDETLLNDVYSRFLKQQGIEEDVEVESEEETTEE